MLGRSKIMSNASNIFYTDENIDRLQAKYYELQTRINDISAWSLAFLPNAIKSKIAIEYMQHGVCRRLKVIGRSCQNIFDILPLDRQTILSSDELNDIQINLHAFLINVHGILDNIAWVYVWEFDVKSLQSPRSRKKVSLFNKEIQELLHLDIKNHLNTEEFKSWFSEYAKIYRDALAHRIPVYVPPFQITHENGIKFNELNQEINNMLYETNFDNTKLQELYAEQSELTEICCLFLHSFNEDNKNPIPLHKQLLEDISKIILITDAFTNSFQPKFNEAN